LHDLVLDLARAANLRIQLAMARSQKDLVVQKSDSLRRHVSQRPLRFASPFTSRGPLCFINKNFRGYFANFLIDTFLLTLERILRREVRGFLINPSTEFRFFGPRKDLEIPDCTKRRSRFNESTGHSAHLHCYSGDQALAS